MTATLTMPGALGAAAPASGSTAARREDIQVLRAIAVLAVLAFHAGVLPAGYLGVDVFFALSGFLMARMILRAQAEGESRLGMFYLRRAARLLPAALATLVVTTALVPFLLTPTQYGAFQADLLGALTQTANVVLWFQTDYFAGAAGTRPLLHMWSLSVEAQFYLLVPLLWLCGRLLGPAVIGGIALSFALALVFGAGLLPLPVTHETMQAAAFYLLPCRAFQFLLGVAAALLVARAGRLRIPAPCGALALAAVLVLLAKPTGAESPGWGAFAVASLTALLCAGDGGWLARGRAAALLAWLGDRSYSVYLVHWPLLAYANAAFLGEAPQWLRLALVAAALPLGALQYRFVEAPFRGGYRRPKRTAARLALASAGCALFAAAVLGPLERSFPQPPAPNVGLAAACDQRGARVIDSAACRTRNAPRVALLGDSYAMQWAAALAEEEEIFGGLVQITKSGCAPSAATDGSLHRDACAAFMADATAKIAAAQHIEVVVVSSSWSRPSAQAAKGSGVEAADALAAAILSVVDGLRAAGKAVLLLAPAPSDGFDVASCHARQRAGLPLPARTDCSLSPDRVRERGAPLRSAFERLEREHGVAVIRPADGLCGADRCRTSIGDTILYADRSHLTREGVRHLARSLQLAQVLGRAPHISLSPLRASPASR